MLQVHLPSPTRWYFTKRYRYAGEQQINTTVHQLRQIAKKRTLIGTAELVFIIGLGTIVRKKPEGRELIAAVSQLLSLINLPVLAYFHFKRHALLRALRKSNKEAKTLSQVT